MIQNNVIGIGAKLLDMGAIYFTTAAPISIAKLLANFRYIS